MSTVVLARLSGLALHADRPGRGLHLHLRTRGEKLDHGGGAAQPGAVVADDQAPLGRVGPQPDRAPPDPDQSGSAAPRRTIESWAFWTSSRMATAGVE
jgi:hypothetical protein